MPRKVNAQHADAQLALFDVDIVDRAPRTQAAPSRARSATRRAVVELADDPPAASPQRDSSKTDALLSPEDVARRCGLSRKAVYRAVGRGELRAARILSRLRIDPRDVEAWIRANIVDASCPGPAPARRTLPASNGLRRLLPEP
jgi:excisionase family DNA binding protein